MRILHVVTNADLGGAPAVVDELTRWAVRNGHEAAMASQAEGPRWVLLDPGVGRFALKHLVKEISLSDDLAAIFELRRLLREYEPDILHVHSSKAGVIGRLAADRRLRARTVYTVHGFDSILKAYRKFLPLERLLQGLCGAVVAVSAYDQRNLAANGISRKLRMIRNGVRDWRGAEPREAAAAAALKRAADAGGSVLCIARLAAPKRFDLFLETAALLPKAGFFWIGNEGEGEGAKLPANVTLLGSLPDAGAYANFTDVLALFSDYEGLPMSILEALSCGTPVVASRVGGVSEALGGGCGETVPNEAAAAAAALARYLPGGDRYGGASRGAARARYEALFSVKAMAEGYAELYSQLSGP